MSDDNQHLPALPSFEETMRYTADELIDLTVNEANSLEEVPAVIDRALAYMRDQLLAVDWTEYDGEFGPIIAQQRLDTQVKSALDRMTNPPSDPPPIDWKTKLPPRLRQLDDEDD